MFGGEVDSWDWDHQSTISPGQTCRVDCAHLSVDPGGIKRLVVKESSIISYHQFEIRAAYQTHPHFVLASPRKEHHEHS
jgi:hypothetical protein